MMSTAKPTPARSHPLWQKRLPDVLLAALLLWFVRINAIALLAGDLAAGVLLLQEICSAVFALTRRRASIVVPWTSTAAMLGWLGLYLPLLLRPDTSAIPSMVAFLGLVLQLLGGVLAIWAVLTLGRSFGIVAAHRGLQTGGPYRSLRHPLYAAYLLIMDGFAIAHPQWHNSIVLVVWLAVQIGRVGAEERVLAADPAYVVYQRRVRYRLIPGVW
jgi:protein-S-isoprenylcysteine O-methyltransferase Ste14